MRLFRVELVLPVGRHETFHRIERVVVLAESEAVAVRLARHDCAELKPIYGRATDLKETRVVGIGQVPRQMAVISGYAVDPRWTRFVDEG